MTTTTTEKKYVFESTECSRCGGSGRFSFNLKDGTMCFGCQGTGKKLTKRGLAAKYFFEDSLSKQVTDCKVGDVIKLSSSSKNFSKITEILFSQADQQFGKTFITVIQQNGVQTRLHNNERVRIFHTPEQKIEKYKAALEFEKTLNKNGK